MNARSCLILALFAPFANTLSAATTFEVASIRQVENAPLTPEDIRAGKRNLPRLAVDGGRLDITNLTMRGILANAYQTAGIYIFGDSWLESVHWDIHATFSEGVGKDQVPALLRILLEQRFGLRAHREMRDMPIYALVEAKGGIRVPELPPDAPTSTQIQSASGKMEVTGTLDSVGAAGAFAGLSAPIENHTGLTGKYKLTMDPKVLYARALQAAPGDSALAGPDDSDAFDRMSTILSPLGLKIERRKVAKDVVVVDRMNRTPSEN